MENIELYHVFHHILNIRTNFDQIRPEYQIGLFLGLFYIRRKKFVLLFKKAENYSMVQSIHMCCISYLSSKSSC